MNIHTQHKMIAVITSTIGRPELERAIISVQQQNYPCKHYVFVDGKQYFDKIQALEAKYPDVIVNLYQNNTIDVGVLHKSFVKSIAWANMIRPYCSILN